MLVIGASGDTCSSSRTTGAAREAEFAAELFALGRFASDKPGNSHPDADNHHHCRHTNHCTHPLSSAHTRNWARSLWLLLFLLFEDPGVGLERGCFENLCYER